MRSNTYVFVMNVVGWAVWEGILSDRKLGIFCIEGKRSEPLNRTRSHDRSLCLLAPGLEVPVFKTETSGSCLSLKSGHSNRNAIHSSVYSPGSQIRTIFQCDEQIVWNIIGWLSALKVRRGFSDRNANWTRTPTFGVFQWIQAGT